MVQLHTHSKRLSGLKNENLKAIHFLKEKKIADRKKKSSNVFMRNAHPSLSSHFAD